MKYSALVCVTLYATVELEAEDPIDAAHRVTVDLCNNPEFFTGNPELLEDDFHIEISPADEASKGLDIDEFDKRVTVFEHDQVAAWLHAIGAPVEQFTVNLPFTWDKRPADE